MKKNIAKELSNLLSDFFNDKSDNSPLEASSQEKLENDFYQYLDAQNSEDIIVTLVGEMCIESLDPETYEKWEDVVRMLYKNRLRLKGLFLPQDIKP